MYAFCPPHCGTTQGHVTSKVADYGTFTKECCALQEFIRDLIFTPYGARVGVRPKCSSMSAHPTFALFIRFMLSRTTSKSGLLLDPLALLIGVTGKNCTYIFRVTAECSPLELQSQALIWICTKTSCLEDRDASVNITKA